MKIYLFKVRCWETDTNLRLWTNMCVAVGSDPFEAMLSVWDEYKSLTKQYGISIKRCNRAGVKMPHNPKMIICERIINE